MRKINDRVHHASAVLALNYERLSGDEERDQAVDLIADLLHLCDARGWGFPLILLRQQCITLPKWKKERGSVPGVGTDPAA